MTTDNAEVWHIVTVKGGVVSFLKNLTHDQARALMQRIGPLNDPWCDMAAKQRAAETAGSLPRMPVYSGMAPNGAPYYLHRDGCYYDFDRHGEQVECWGPDGAEMEVWPEPADWPERYAAALAIEEETARQQREAEQLVERTNRAMGVG